MKKHHLFIFLFLYVSLTSVNAQEFESFQQLTSDTTIQLKVVPIGSIPKAVEETNQLIREIDQILIPPDNMLNIDSTLSIYQDKIDSLDMSLKSGILETPVFRDFEREINELGKYNSNLSNYNDLLNQEISKLENESLKIQQIADIWKNTTSAEWYSEVSEAIRAEINNLDKKIKDTKGNLQEAINKYLEVQIQLNSQNALVKEMQDLITAQELEQDRNLFMRTSHPFWKMIKSDMIKDLSKSKILGIIELRRYDITEYYQTHKSQIYFALMYLLLTQIFFMYLKYQIGKTEFEKELDKSQNVALKLLENNWSTGLVFGLTIVYVFLYDRPLVISTTLYLIAIFPLYFLFTRVIEIKYHFLIRFLFVIFLLTLISDPFLEIAILRRILFFVLDLLIFVWLLILIRKGLLNIFQMRFIKSVAKLLSQIFLVLLLISLITNILGSFRYSVYVTYAIAGSFFYGLLVYLLYLILLGVSTASLNNKSTNALRIIKKFKNEIQYRISSALRFFLTLIYIVLVLRSFKIGDDALQLFIGFIEYPISIGDFTFDIGGIFLFIIILLMSRWIAKLTVFILDEQILYQPGRKKNLVASVSSLVKFTIITVGFLIAIIAIGFELDKLTILISAFGVGIGFGLQNIFNNLVSGIIMVFEQPLQVGDVIEVGQLIGEVKSIGIRSSTVRTYDGSEVIVPNGNLISKDLINWTHSDMKRRLIVKVGVKYGTDPQKVIDILVSEAQKNENILERPKPYVLFKQFGDSSLNFELRCWTDDFDNWIFVDSELRVEVNNALKNAGITIPFPQRDLHMYTTEAGNIPKPVQQKKK